MTRFRTFASRFSTLLPLGACLSLPPANAQVWTVLAFDAIGDSRDRAVVGVIPLFRRADGIFLITLNDDGCRKTLREWRHKQQT